MSGGQRMGWVSDGRPGTASTPSPLATLWGAIIRFSRPQLQVRGSALVPAGICGDAARVDHSPGCLGHFPEPSLSGKHSTLDRSPGERLPDRSRLRLFVSAGVP
jgi:hypothetical protein